MTVQLYKLVSLGDFLGKLKGLTLPFRTSYKVSLLAKETEKNTTFY
jgi:hypothetical protein